jgi:hypothetical protein
VPGWQHRLSSNATRRSALKRLALIIVTLLAVGCGASAQAQEMPPERPNVVFILADDLDKRLLTSHLSDYSNIQALAANGTTFSEAFVTNALCCPSRSAAGVAG